MKRKIIYGFLGILCCCILGGCSGQKPDSATADQSKTVEHTKTDHEKRDTDIAKKKKQKEQEETKEDISRENEEEQETEETTGLEDESVKNQELTFQVQSYIENMTLEEKVAQLFMVTPEQLTQVGTVTWAGEITKNAFDRYPVGGVILFESNLQSESQVKELTQGLQVCSQERSNLPLLISIDEEGGLVSRIGKNSGFSVTTFPAMWEIGESGDLSMAYHVGETIGAYLKEYGCNMDFAPDADVLTNPDNQVIGKRSFGSEGEAVAQMTSQVCKGLFSQGVAPCLKHFPGHGGTLGDSHKGYAYTERTKEELLAQELVPFQKGIQEDVPFIMVSHIALPNVTGNEEPSSLSKEIVTDLLREEMGYDGIVITDAMNMGAITKEYDSAAASVKAIEAGVDIILMPKDFQTAMQGVIDAVNNGIISQDRIDTSLKRILEYKLQKLV